MNKIVDFPYVDLLFVSMNAVDVFPYDLYFFALLAMHTALAFASLG